jgi:hypothetical protein
MGGESGVEALDKGDDPSGGAVGQAWRSRVGAVERPEVAGLSRPALALEDAVVSGRACPGERDREPGAADPVAGDAVADECEAGRAVLRKLEPEHANGAVADD